MTPQEASIKAREICMLAPVIPVLVIEDASSAANLARALIAGGWVGASGGDICGNRKLGARVV